MAGALRVLTFGFHLLLGCFFSESASSDRKPVNGFASRGSPALGWMIWLPRSLHSEFSRLARSPWPSFVRSSRDPRSSFGICSSPPLSFALSRGHRSVLTGPTTSCTRPSRWSLRFWVFWAVGNTSAAPEGLCQAQQSPAKTKRPQRKLPGRTIEKLSTRAVHSWPYEGSPRPRSTELFPRPAGAWSRLLPYPRFRLTAYRELLSYAPSGS